MNRNTYAIDWETYYERTNYTLRKLSTEAYVNHPKFNAYMVSIVGPGLEYVGTPEDAPWSKISDQIWVSHNADFDRQVYAKWSEGRTTVKPFQWHCSMQACAWHQLPQSLAGAVRILFHEELEKGVRDGMAGRLPADLNEDEFERLRQYALLDSIWCLALWNYLVKTWPESEQIIGNHTIESGVTGVNINVNALLGGIEKLQGVINEESKKIPWKETHALLSPHALRRECARSDIPAPISTAKDSEECETWMEKYSEKFPWVGAMRILRSASKHLAGLETIKDRLYYRDSGSMFFKLKYFGAALTGRWSGDAGFNLQNLPRKEMFGVNIRHLIVARPGYKLIQADLAQIEPRCAAHVVGDEEMIKSLNAGMDVYEAHARATMGYDDPRPLKDVDPEMRLMAKVRVLSLGYQAGAGSLKAQALGYGLELSDSRATQIVAEFRRSNPKIVKMWERLGNNFQKSKKDHYKIGLPSGRDLHYWNVRYDKGWQAQTVRDDDTPKRSLRFFYAGKIFENVIQGLARDVMAEKIVELISNGYNVLWSIHDEVVVEVPEDRAEHAAADIQYTMAKECSFLPGLPLNAETEITDKYTK